MVHSKLWDVQDALFDLLADTLSNDAATARVKVTLGTPLKITDEDVWISGEVPEWSQEYVASGLAAKEENFTLRVCVAVQRLGLEYGPIRDRAKYIGEQIENAIHNDPTLGGNALLARVASPMLEEVLVGEKKRAVGLNFDVEVMTYLNA